MSSLFRNPSRYVAASGLRSSRARAHVKGQSLVAAKHGDIDRRVFGLLQAVDHGLDRDQRLAIQGDDLVIFLEADLGCGRVGFHLSHDDRLGGVPSGGADFRSR